MLQSFINTPNKSIRKILTLISYVFVSVFFVCISYTLIRAYTVTTTGRTTSGIDFMAYITGASILKSNPTSLYTAEAQAEFQKSYLSGDYISLLAYRNTPLVAFLYTPYTLMPEKYAYLINYFVQLLLAGVYVLLLLQFI